MSNFIVSTDYNQFFLLDGDVQPLYPETITDSALENRYQTIPHLIAIYTSSAITVSLSVEVCNIKPKPDLISWSHIVLCQLSLPSGRLVIAGCTDYLPDCPCIEVEKGTCGVLISARGLEECEQEEYLIQVWPGNTNGSMVLKHCGKNAG